MKTAVVIPAYNEGARVRPVVMDARKYADAVIVVDDGSDDDTSGQIPVERGKVYLAEHRINLGKGAALKTGVEAAISLGAEIIVLMDADGQHRTSDIPRFVDALYANHVDIVFGSRKIGRDMPLVMMLGNKFLSIMTSLLFHVYISDTQSGFRAFRAQAYTQLKWSSPRYAVETEMIVNTGRRKVSHAEIDIDTIYQDKYKGTTVIDGIRIFINILKWKIL